MRGRERPPAPPPEAEPPGERPPYLGSWRALYALVLLELALVILLCHWITRKYS
jgi:hypothetical protein